MEHLPNDVQSIVYKYLHKSKWDCVTSEYYERFGLHWNNDKMFFFNHFTMTRMAMYRFYTKKGWRGVVPWIESNYVYRIFGNGNSYSIGNLPKNY